MIRNAQIHYLDKTFGDRSVPEIMDESTNIDKSQNPLPNESALKTRKGILFKDINSNHSSTTQGQSQRNIEVNNTHILTSQNKDPFKQKTVSVYKTQATPTTQENINYFKMNTSAFSRIFMFDYLKILIDLYKKIRKTHIFSYSHIPELEMKERISYQYDKFSLIYYKKLERKLHQNKPFTPNDMLFVLLQTHLAHFVQMGFILVFFFACKIGSSLCIRELLNAIDENSEMDTIYLWTVLICISLLLVSMLDQYYVRVLVVQYQSLRILLMKHIHTKISQLSAFTISQNNIGQLMNLVSNDLKILETKTGEILKLPILPLPTIAAAIISYYRFGIYSLVGLSFLIACVPIQTLLGKMSKTYFSKKAAVSDKRMLITNEVLESIRLIKLYSWEEAFTKILKLIRSQDLRLLLKTKIIQAIENSISLTSGIFSCFLMFYLVLKYEDHSSLTLANMFSTLDIFLFLRQEVISQSGIGITGLFEIKVVMKRIVNILSIESKEMLSINQHVEAELTKSQIGDSFFCPVGEIRLKNFSAFWKYSQPVIINLTTSISPGQLVTIMGPVSSGKSSLLSCFIKEIPYYTGEINFKGKIAYVEQEPYIFNMSFRDNVLFGQKFDHDLYVKVLQVCNLFNDIDMLGGDDSFEIGEKGNNLSGGQRARLALARALYSQADIYLLDDPLSALDYNVSKEIFQNAIQNFLKGKTVLLTTHSLDIIQQSDKVIALDGGYPVEQGDPKELYCFLEELHSSPNKSPTKSLQTSMLTQKDAIRDELEVLELIQQRSKRKTKKLIKIRKDDSIHSLRSKKQLCSYNQLNQQNLRAIQLERTHIPTLKSIKLTEEESDNQKVTFSTYKTYFSFSSFKCLYPICLVLFMSNEVTYILFTKTMGKFAGENKDEYYDNVIWLGIYTLAYFLIMLVKKVLLNYLLNNNNYELHQAMIKSILRAKISYFDKTPIGIIINRFSSDLNLDLSKSLSDSLEVICNTITLLTTIVMLNPYFIIVTLVSAIVLTFFFSLSKNVLIATKQFDLNLKSTVFSFFNTSIQGILPIKLFNQSNQFKLQFNKILDNSLRTAYTYWFTNRGFGMYIIFIAQISSIIGIFMALSINSDGSNLGQTITFFISLGYKLQSGLRQLIQLDVIMSSAQRAINLTQLDQEPPLRTKYDKIFQAKKRASKRLSRLIGDEYNFPMKGKVEFKNVFMSYSDDKKTVLNGVTFNVEPGQKVAFVGRTGAGKSSILQALFRMFEIQKMQTQSSQANIGQTQKIVTFQNILESEPNQIVQARQTVVKEEFLETLDIHNTEGSIKIDNHNIEDVGIKTLRDGFTIIPQIPFIFTGSIRMNIDPLGLYTDEQIWEVIRDIQLEQKIKEFPSGINTEISNSSETFSAGQKQLICLARAMLKRSKILVLDEVTSNCDAYSEDLILDIINKKFIGSTVIAIAHRLNTIADYDKIFVMDKGKLAEQGTAEELLKIQDGIFAKMVNSSGQKISQLIRKVQRGKQLLMLNHLEVPSPAANLNSLNSPDVHSELKSN